MTYTTEYYYAPRYEYASTNQHGNRFKRVLAKKINEAGDEVIYSRTK